MQSVTKLLGCILFICHLQASSLAAPTHVIKRDQDILFGQYSCRIQKVVDSVRTKLNVSH